MLFYGFLGQFEQSSASYKLSVLIATKLGRRSHKLILDFDSHKENEYQEETKQTRDNKK
jgi:hypothetical protein